MKKNKKKDDVGFKKQKKILKAGIDLAIAGAVIGIGASIVRGVSK